MSLEKYDNKYVKIVDINDDIYEGRAYYNSHEYNFHEFGCDEEGLQILNMLFYKNSIKSIRIIKKMHGFFGRVEEIIVSDGIETIEDVLNSKESEHIYRLLLCIETKLFDLPYCEELIKLLKKYQSNDKRISNEINKIIRIYSGDNEIWDLYDSKGNVTGLKHIRGDELPDNLYHLVVHIWIKNKEGKYLISRRASTRKNYPLYFECQGGSVLYGESSLEGALREVKEEVGIDLNKDFGKIIYRKVRKKYKNEKFNDIMDVWMFNYNGKVDLKKATTDEVCEVSWMSIDEIKKLFCEGKLVPTLEYIFKRG